MQGKFRLWGLSNFQPPSAYQPWGISNPEGPPITGPSLIPKASKDKVGAHLNIIMYIEACCKYPFRLTFAFLALPPNKKSHA
jgi:hypothetical protein